MTTVTQSNSYLQHHLPDLIFEFINQFGRQTLALLWEMRDINSLSLNLKVGELQVMWCRVCYTGCPRRNVKYFGRVFHMLNYTDITQNIYVQSWTVTEIMAREKCGHLAFPRTVRLQMCSALTLTEQCSTHLCDGTSSAQRDKIAFHYCRYVQCLITLRKPVIWMRVFL